MDNITHTLAAAAIAKTGVGRGSRLLPAAVIVAANVPDVDFAARLFGGPAAYFVHHRGITHAFLGIALEIPLLTALFWAVQRMVLRRAARIPSEARASPVGWRRLALAVTCGLATQPLFDWFNTYGIRPWLPFDGRWHYGDLAYIVDPWLWLLFGGAACLAGRRRRWGSVALVAVAALGCVVLWWMPRSGANPPPTFLRVAWLLAAVLLGVGRWQGWGRGRPNAVVAVAALLTACYLVGLGWAGHAAWDRYGRQLVAQFPPGETLRRHMWSPQPANPLAWTLVAETEQAVYRQDVDLLGNAGGVARFERNLDEPVAQAALATADGRAWRSFARFPIAQVLHEPPAARVLLLDARYPVEPPQRNWCRMVIDLGRGRCVPSELGESSDN